MVAKHPLVKINIAPVSQGDLNSRLRPNLVRKLVPDSCEGRLLSSVDALHRAPLRVLQAWLVIEIAAVSVQGQHIDALVGLGPLFQVPGGLEGFLLGSVGAEGLYFNFVVRLVIPLVELG